MSSKLSFRKETLQPVSSASAAKPLAPSGKGVPVANDPRKWTTTTLTVTWPG